MEHRGALLAFCQNGTRHPFRSSQPLGSNPVRPGILPWRCLRAGCSTGHAGVEAPVASMWERQKLWIVTSAGSSQTLARKKPLTAEVVCSTCVPHAFGKPHRWTRGVLVSTMQPWQPSTMKGVGQKLVHSCIPRLLWQVHPQQRHRLRTGWRTQRTQ